MSESRKSVRRKSAPAPAPSSAPPSLCVRRGPWVSRQRNAERGLGKGVQHVSPDARLSSIHFPSLRVRREPGVRGSAPRFRISETPKGAWGKVCNTFPQMPVYCPFIFPASRQREPEGGGASFGKRTVKSGARTARRDGRAGETGDAGVHPRARQAKAPVRCAIRYGAPPFPVAYDCVSKGKHLHSKRSLRSVTNQARGAGGGRAPRGGRDGAKNRSGRRSGSAQGAGRGSGRKPRAETPAAPARGSLRPARTPRSAEPSARPARRRARDPFALPSPRAIRPRGRADSGRSRSSA